MLALLMTVRLVCKDSTMPDKSSWLSALLRFCFLAICCATRVFAAAQEAPRTEFISFEVARPILAAFSHTLPAEVKPLGSQTGDKWSPGCGRRIATCATG